MRRQREPSLETPAISQFFALFDIFKPLKNAWWAIFGANISWGLHTIYSFLAANPILAAIGAYGVAIIILTILIKTILSPLYQLQLRLSRRSMMEQRKLAPELAALRKKYKNDPQKQQSEMMALYKEHGVNPLGGLTGCLPALLQIPILTALYYVFLGNAKNHTFPTDHFLFVPHLNVTPGSHPLFAGLPIPSIEYAIIPLLAAATTFIQSKMIQQPRNPMASEQEQQTQQMTQSMQVMMPLMIAYFAIVTPAGLGLYWFISNCFAIIQQYFVNGWGGLRPGPPAPPAPPSAPAVVTPNRPPNRPPKRPRKPRK